LQATRRPRGNVRTRRWGIEKDPLRGTRLVIDWTGHQTGGKRLTGFTEGTGGSKLGVVGEMDRTFFTPYDDIGRGWLKKINGTKKRPRKSKRSRGEENVLELPSERMGRSITSICPFSLHFPGWDGAAPQVQLGSD